MKLNAIYYHENYAPNGKEFDMTAMSREILEEQGWVDHPWKAGTSQSPEGRAMYEGVKNGTVKQMDDPGPVQPNDEDNLRTAEIEAAHRALRQERDENERLRQELREMKEKERDHESDAEKERAKTAGEAAAQTAKNRKAAEKAEAERAAEAEAKAKADLDAATAKKDPEPEPEPEAGADAGDPLSEPEGGADTGSTTDL